MEDIVIKKKPYTVLEELGPHSYKVERDGTIYYAKQFGLADGMLSDFKYAHKRLKCANVKAPKLFVLDKKTGFVLLEYISGETVFERLVKEDLSEKIIEKAFQMNWLARTSGLLLHFNPQNFRIVNDDLYYLPFTFDTWSKAKDFSQIGIYQWFYTTQFRNMLIEKGIPIDKSRILNEYDRNKQLVLMVVKYYR